MRDAIADLVRDGDTVAIEGFTHLISFAAGHEIIRQRRRDLTLARLTPGRHLRPDDRGRRRPQARLLVARQPGRRRSWRDPAADRGRHPGRAARGRGVQPLRDGRAVHGRRDEPAVLPAAELLRDGPAEGQSADPPDRARRTATGRSTPCRRSGPDVAIVHAQRAIGRRRHPGLGPARLPEGGGLRRRPGDRRRRGARRRGGRPGRPEPDDHPRPDRRCGRRRAVGRASVVRPGRVRPRQPVLPRLGPDHAATRRRPRPGCATGSTTSTVARPTSTSSGADRVASLKPGRAPSGSVDYGEYR